MAERCPQHGGSGCSSTAIPGRAAAIVVLLEAAQVRDSASSHEDSLSAGLEELVSTALLCRGSSVCPFLLPWLSRRSLACDTMINGFV